MNTEALKPERWGLIFIMLSLDITVPLYDALGLGWLKADQFVPLLRNLILENRRLYVANTSSIPALPDKVLEAVAHSLGRQSSRKLYDFALHTFIEVSQDQPRWSPWQILFHRFAYNAGIALQIGLPVETQQRLREAYRRVVRADEVKEASARSQSKMLSDWDLEMYSIHQFSEEINDPFDTLYATVQMHRFQEFWATWIPQLTEGEQLILWQQGQRVLRDMGLESELVPPRELQLP